ncbi:MAG: sigma-54-dependent Fis family transcriptional regulator [Bryobacterales bacterium]|nr:sigma-54-dependent Fis family transcriptional regulator [Bryobacterales bacterium]
MSDPNTHPPYVLAGRSPEIEKIRRQAARAGCSSAPVLLLGESGSGKEIVARLIHEAGRGGPFVPIDCGALVASLMESELFGHVKGAFTGAAESKPGLIEEADNGTAFLDEIGDLPLEMQVKLLRLLQEREYRPVGSLAWRKANVRVIAATHRDLEKEVSERRFRQDLYYRLNVIVLRLPPLRERKQDIPLLIEHFLRQLRRPYSLTQEALDALVAYDWPGNVRELRNAIERMTAMNSGPLLHSADLPSPVRNHADAGRSQLLALSAAVNGAGRASAAPAAGSPSVLPLLELEKRAILDALRQTKGDLVMTAYLLGIGRTTLYRKLKEYNIPR